MAKREWLMLAQTYNADKHMGCPCWLVSEKLDGMRAFWDGGISRGVPASEVPYANVAKHDRYINPPLATGLWTRLGQPIQAPNWWLDELPKIPLDGELWVGRGKFQTVTSIARKIEPIDDEWRGVEYWVFDSPPPATVFAEGTINTGFFKKTFKTDVLLWVMSRIKDKNFICLTPDAPYYEARAFLKKYSRMDTILEQKELPASGPKARAMLDAELDRIEQLGGEGLMLRSPSSFWRPERSWNLLKVKRLQDMEGTVIGYKWARPTDLDRSLTGESTDKLLGLMGCVTLRLDSGVVFDLGSGFTHAERSMVDSYGVKSTAPGLLDPGGVVRDEFSNPLFPRDTRITFRYRELTNDGVPKEARYWRKS